MKTDHQQLAQDLYLNTDKTQQEIADILNVNRRTVYLWVKNGRWEEMKLAAKQAPGIILQDIYNHIEAINGKIRKRDPDDRAPTMPEVEMLRKLVNMTKVMQKKHTGGYIEAFMELIIYINQVDHDLAMRTHKYADQYVHGSLADKSFYAPYNPEVHVSEVKNNLKKEKLSAVPEEQVGCDPSRSPSYEQPKDEPVILSKSEVPPKDEPVPGPLRNTSSPKPALSIVERDRSGEASCDINAIFSPAPEQTLKSAETPSGTVSDTISATEGQPTKYPIGNFSQNGIFPAPETKTDSGQGPIKPMLLRKVPHLSANKKKLWDIGFAEIQKILGLYNATGLPALRNDQFSALFNDTYTLLYNKINSEGSNPLGNIEKIGIEQVLNSLTKPMGYNDLVTAIISFVGNGQKDYKNSYDRAIFEVKNITQYFMLDDEGSLQYTPALQKVIDGAGDQYIKTEKGQNTYRFTCDIQKAFFANNMDRYLGCKGKISSRALFDFLSKAMEGIDLEAKEVIPVYHGASGYYPDTCK